MDNFLKNIYLPSKDSHKGQNGRLLIIGGSHLFHSASLWSLKVASRIVDLVHYSSIPENNKIVQKLKEEFRDGIVVPRSEIDNYIQEDDCILIGPGMVRTENPKSEIRNPNLNEILEIEDEGLQTYYLTKYLLQKYPQKRWVIDAGALQMMEPAWIPANAILTPHHLEFKRLFGRDYTPQLVGEEAKKHNCIILVKGKQDIVCSPKECKTIKGGNAGMTKGGTGDVLAGLVSALYCKNDPFLSATAASYINKKAGEDLFKKMGYFFNASDLADQIPQTMNKLLL
ncbi:NAD(P)H-hydrate dehydratase [Candidatus Gottesmanbacteria bacterium]|nr:NAD(P)H-hydrate dehydratase [Candidatus Gottesmanbacteria bacterium]